mmetsp:Transcript_17636/g.40948  ORF Transcript_17636/g.40948 Transcript_17636/m.40948 type:complete len:87 (-) Transcript_17636:337-597(-)
MEVAGVLGILGLATARKEAAPPQIGRLRRKSGENKKETHLPQTTKPADASSCDRRWWRWWQRSLIFMVRSGELASRCALIGVSLTS